MLYDRKVGKVSQKCGDQCDDDDGRRDHAERSCDSADNATIFIAHEGSCVDGNDAGSTLPDRKIIHQLILGCPVMFFHDLPLEHGQHGVASPEGECTDPKENHK